MLCVGDGIPIGQTIWQLSTGDEKSIPDLKINILWDHGHMANSITYFGSFSIPGIDFSPNKPSKNTGSKLWITGYPGPHLVAPLFYSSNSRKYLADRQLSVHNKKTRDICILSVRSDYASSTNMFPRTVQYDAVLIVYLFLLYKFTHFLIKFVHPLR
jgi:hypothetical protein